MGSKLGIQAGSPLGHKLGLQAGTPLGPQSSIKDGVNATTIPQPSIPENQNFGTCINKFGSERIARTHADPLPPQEPPPKCITSHEFLCVLYFNCSKTTDQQTPLDIEIRPLEVHRGADVGGVLCSPESFPVTM